MVRFAVTAAAVLGFALTAALGNLLAPLLRALDPAQDAPGPNAPPGGLALIVGALAAVGVGWVAACALETGLLGSETRPTTRLLLALAGALAFGAVGLVDDLVRLRRRQPLGLRARERLALECGAAAFTVLAFAASGCLPAGVTLPGLGYIGLGLAALPLTAGLLIALAECARAVCGAEGVLSGTAFVAMLALIQALALLGWYPLAVLPAALAGALMAFLLWDFPPAKLCPGSAGALFLAGALGCIPLCAGWPGLAVPLSLPWWLEGGMLALQVLACRLHRRGLFATAPLHAWLARRGTGPAAVFALECGAAACGAALALGLLRLS